jgi:hypothetical protein
MTDFKLAFLFLASRRPERIPEDGSFAENGMDKSLKSAEQAEYAYLFFKQVIYIL